MENEEEPTMDGIKFFAGREGGFSTVMWMPHREEYKTVLNLLKSNDIVCDMGAGDLRFPLMMSQKVQKVYAVELCPSTAMVGLKAMGWSIPRNLIVVIGDWTKIAIPPDVTIITCLVNGVPQTRLKLWANGPRVLHSERGTVTEYRKGKYTGTVSRCPE